MTLNGVPMFVSKCFGGRISGKELAARSGIFDDTPNGQPRFVTGDAKMVGRSFDIEELVESKCIKLNPSAFLKGKDQLIEEEVIETPCRAFDNPFRTSHRKNH